MKVRLARADKCTSELKKDDRRLMLEGAVQEEEAVEFLMSGGKKKGRKERTEGSFGLTVDNSMARAL